MDVICTHWAGWDVQKKTVMACQGTPDPTRQQADGRIEGRECGPLTIDLWALSDWVAAVGSTHVAMERTGESWKPVSNLLKDTYLSTLYHRQAARRGKKRAIMAVAHSIVVSAFHMLSRNEPYQELGAHYFDAHRREHLVDRLTRRMQRLGSRVSIEPVPAA